jgi:hypothetical protein
MAHRDTKKFRKASLRPRPSPPDDAPDRKLKTPQYNEMMRRRHGRGPKNVAKWQNGKRLKDIIKRLAFHRSTNPDDFAKHRADYLIAAAHHCPESQHLEDWLPRWFDDHLLLPGLSNLDVKMTVIFDHGRLEGLSAEEVAALLPTTFDERQALGLWTFGTIDMTTLQRKRRAKKERQQKERERRAKKRLAAGAKPHAESLSQTQPWVALGIERRQWERRRKAGKL